MMSTNIFENLVAERVEAENCTYTEAAHDLYTLRCCIDTIAWQLEYLEAAVICDSPLMMESCRDRINSCLSEMTAEGVLI